MRKNHEQIPTILREAMTQLSFAIITLNAEATITFASANVSSLLGYSPPELVFKCRRSQHFGW